MLGEQYEHLGFGIKGKTGEKHPTCNGVRASTALKINQQTINQPETETTLVCDESENLSRLSYNSLQHAQPRSASLLLYDENRSFVAKKQEMAFAAYA